MTFLHFNTGKRHPLATQRTKKLWQSRTVAVEAFSAKEIEAVALLSIASSGSQPMPIVTLNVGVTFLSFKDRYDRRIGREEAIKRMEKVELAVRCVEVTGKHITLYLETYKGVNMRLRANRLTGFSTVLGVL